MGNYSDREKKARNRRQLFLAQQKLYEVILYTEC